MAQNGTLSIALHTLIEHMVQGGTHLPPFSEVRCFNPRPYVGKLVVAYQYLGADFIKGLKTKTLVLAMSGT